MLFFARYIIPSAAPAAELGRSAAEGLRVEVSLFEANLQPFLTTLGWLVGGRLDADDFEAVAWGLRDTDREAGRWFGYEFGGEARTPFAVALDEAGASIVWVRAEFGGAARRVRPAGAVAGGLLPVLPLAGVAQTPPQELLEVS